jgi:hypothetical protein
VKRPLVCLSLLTSVAGVFLLPVFVLLQSCTQSASVETVSVSLKSAETFQYPTVSGDEEGARISVQPKHYNTSEIRRNAATNWIATFVYQPTTGFVGSDDAAIEIMTGSDGASPPRNVKRVVFHFDVHN